MTPKARGTPYGPNRRADQRNKRVGEDAAIYAAERHVDDARTIGWKALEQSWQRTLDELLGARRRRTGAA